MDSEENSPHAKGKGSNSAKQAPASRQESQEREKSYRQRQQLLSKIISEDKALLKQLGR